MCLIFDAIATLKNANPKSAELLLGLSMRSILVSPSYYADSSVSCDGANYGHKYNHSVALMPDKTSDGKTLESSVL